MVAHQKHAAVAQHPGQPVPFAVRKAHSTESFVYGQLSEEAHGVLVYRGHSAVGQRRERRRVPGMQMHHASGLRTASMNAAVNMPRSRVGRVGTVERGRVFRVQQDQVRSSDARKVPPARVHQEEPSARFDGEAEMVGERLVHA